MIALVKSICGDCETHEPSQFSVISIFLGETGCIITNVWIVVDFESGHQIK